MAKRFACGGINRFEGIATSAFDPLTVDKLFVRLAIVLDSWIVRFVGG